MTIPEGCPFAFNSGDKVLFLGEGNFSFSSCLLKHLKAKDENTSFHEVYVTCFQKELSSTSSRNVNYLQSLGAQILLDVDATKLHVNQRISHNFDKIIFNFPHIGGKMKIHLNRELLCSFFISASKVLGPSGTVVVTLCSGQGGTGFDETQRRWDDSWQVVAQAAYGRLILYRIELFPQELFEGYKPVGYRGREQMFHISSAVVHSFQKAETLCTHLTASSIAQMQSLCSINDDLFVSPIHKSAIDSNPLSRGDSPQTCLKSMLQSSFKLFDRNSIIVDNNLPLTIEFNNLAPQCEFKKQKYCLRSSLFQVVPSDFLRGESISISGLVFSKCSSEFSDFCARCHCLMKCSHVIIKNVISDVISKYKFSGSVLEEVQEDQWTIYFQNESFLKNRVVWGSLKTKCFEVDLDLLCSYIFCVPVRQLWCSNIKFDVNLNLPIPPSLYPLQFVFDISFACKHDLDFDEFHYVLHQLPDNIIESVALVSAYQLPESNEISYCFRLSYRSYSKPLNRKLAIQYQEAVVGKLLANVFGARIR